VKYLTLKQVATLLVAKGRIAAATYRITFANAGYSTYFTIGREMFPEIAPSPGGAGSPPSSPHPITPKQHLVRFSRFVWLTVVSNRQTHTDT